MTQAVGQEQLHAGALRGDAWMDRFAAHAGCSGREVMDFPKDAKAVEALRKTLTKTQTPQTILVHSDELQDGLMALDKKTAE